MDLIVAVLLIGGAIVAMVVAATRAFVAIGEQRSDL
jgi:hypothetical protein